VKFRIIEYLGMYKPQVGREVWNGKGWEERWNDIGEPLGYGDIITARNVCEVYKAENNPTVIEEFTL
jgi:hypothetical protein